MVKKENRSVKQQILDAFMELMTQKSYMEITVTDLVTTAQVARVSFYRNFDSINDVIDTIIDELSDEYMEDILPTLISNDERKWREFLFEYFYRFLRNQKKFTAIGFQNMAVFFSRMNAKMQLKESELPNRTIYEKYAPFGKLGMINNIAKKWMDDGMKETPEEMINFIMTFITSI